MCRRSSLIVFSLMIGLAGTALAAEPAALTLAVQIRDDGTTLVTGRVTDAKGAPAPGVLVAFQVQTAFGWLLVAEVKTDRTGEARVVLPRTRAGEIRAEAEDGDTTLRAAKWIDRVSPPAPATRPGRDVLSGLSPQPGFISPYPVPLEVAILALALGGIWMTYAYLVSLLVRIRRAPQEWKPH